MTEHCLDAIHGPLAITLFGVPDWEKLYEKADVLEGGVLSGHSKQTDIFLRFLDNRRRPLTPQQALPTFAISPTDSECLSCSSHQSCPQDQEYQCVANVLKSSNTKMMRGCCKLPYYPESPARRLLSNSSLPGDVQTNATGGSSPLPPAIIKSGCPCNCTYVSQACCGVQHGLVYEAADLKLGGLDPSNSTSC